jgi:hypothetical protein
LRRERGWLAALALLALALYARNWNDYFIGDDFDLIHSFHGKPFGYFPALLWSNESGDVWKSWGIDPALGRGYLRPLKIWVLALDAAIWGANPLGYHLTSSVFFVAAVLLVYAILRRALPERPLLAAAGAGAAALHPVFAEVVPFLTSREELMAVVFGLAAFLCFLRHREDGRSSLPFHLCYAAALLTKESAIVYLALPLGWDLAHGRIWPLSRAGIRDLARTYGPSAALLGAYFALRWIAFGNFVGGDGGSLRYLDSAALGGFHVQFWSSMADETLFSLGSVNGAGVIIGGYGALLAGAAIWSVSHLPASRRRALLFFGPLWYLAATAILHGTYFAVRHNALPVIGVVAFATVAVDALLESGVLRSTRVAALGLFASAAALWLPPTLATSAEWSAAASSVSRIRAIIEERTAGLEPGCAVSLSGVPQWVLPPFLFGWGLRSALARPFTASDLAEVCTVYDARNWELTGVTAPKPARFDREIELDPAEFVKPWLERRHLLRLWREGIVARGVRSIP